jgi:hypothetical protein
LWRDLGKKTLMVADGHHRSLAYVVLKEPMVAYVGYAPAVNGPWDTLHDSQNEREDKIKNREAMKRESSVGGSVVGRNKRCSNGSWL